MCVLFFIIVALMHKHGNINVRTVQSSINAKYRNDLLKKKQKLHTRDITNLSFHINNIIKTFWKKQIFDKLWSLALYFLFEITSYGIPITLEKKLNILIMHRC